MIAGVASFLVVLMIWNALLVKDALPGRIKALNKQRSTLKNDLVNQPKRLSKKRAATTSNYEKDQHVKKTKGSRETNGCRFDKNEEESAITETYHAETVNKQQR